MGAKIDEEGKMRENESNQRRGSEAARPARNRDSSVKRER